MSNQALPRATRQLLETHENKCKHLGLLLDKFAPWGNESRSGWDLVMSESIRRRGQTTIQPTTGGQAKGLWLSTTRRAKNGETPSLFENERVDPKLMGAVQDRWLEMVKAEGGQGFTMQLAERMAAGLGASSVLETGLTLDRNTGLPYLPGSTVKGLARAWGLIYVASQLGIELEQTLSVKGRDEPDSVLNLLAELLISTSDETIKRVVWQDEHATSASEAKTDPPFVTALRGHFAQHKPQDSKACWDWIAIFRTIFGSQGWGGSFAFLDGIYAGETEPQYATDVMTPHYVQYYTGAGGSAPADDDNPNPISFLTVDRGNVFAFGVVPRGNALNDIKKEQEPVHPLRDMLQELGEEKLHDILWEECRSWLVSGLTRLGAGSKTAAGYGFFRGKSRQNIT